MLDVTIKSAFCCQCLKMKEKKESGDVSYIDYLKWYTKHESECLKNHEDSSGVSKYNSFVIVRRYRALAPPYEP